MQGFRGWGLPAGGVNFHSGPQNQPISRSRGCPRWKNPGFWEEFGFASQHHQSQAPRPHSRDTELYLLESQPGKPPLTYKPFQPSKPAKTANPLTLTPYTRKLLDTWSTSPASATMRIAASPLEISGLHLLGFRVTNLCGTHIQSDLWGAGATPGPWNRHVFSPTVNRIEQPGQAENS